MRGIHVCFVYFLLLYRDRCQFKDLRELIGFYKIAILQRRSNIIQPESILNRQIGRPIILCYRQFYVNHSDILAHIHQFCRLFLFIHDFLHKNSVVHRQGVDGHII